MAGLFKRFFWIFLVSAPLFSLTTQGNQIVDDAGEPVTLHGAAFTGAEDAAGAANQMKLLGFNAVRLPFSFEDLGSLMETMQAFAKEGFYVLLDGKTAIENPEQWVKNWTALFEAIAAEPALKEKTMVSLLNDPDASKVRWEELKDFYLTAMDALYALNPGLLFFIQGAGQNKDGGFSTDAKLISKYKLSDPTPFFQALLDKPYKNQVVIAPRIYFPNAPKMPQDFMGASLWSRLSTSFGYLTLKGFEGKTFPVALVEFGSKLDGETSTQMMADLAVYLNEANDGRHEPIPNWFWGSWTSNSAVKAPGILDPESAVRENLVAYLGSLHLKPPAPEAPRKGQLCLTVLAAPGIEGLPKLSIEGIEYSFSGFGLPFCLDLPPGSYTIALRSIATKTMEFTAAPSSVVIEAGKSTALTLAYEGKAVQALPPLAAFTKTGWPVLKNGVYQVPVEITFVNNSEYPIGSPWSIVIKNPAYKSVSGIENMNVRSVKQGEIRGYASQALPANGGTFQVRFVVSTSSLDTAPKEIHINGKPCLFTP